MNDSTAVPLLSVALFGFVGLMSSCTEPEPPIAVPEMICGLAPSCAGSCPDGSSCVHHPTGICQCLGSIKCRAFGPESAAQCGGLCPEGTSCKAPATAPGTCRCVEEGLPYPNACSSASTEYGCDGACWRDDGSINPYTVCLQVGHECQCVPRLTPCASSTPELGCDAACLHDDGSVDGSLFCEQVGEVCTCVQVPRSRRCSSSTKPPMCDAVCAHDDGSVDPGSVCKPVGDVCTCVPRKDPCSSAKAPACDAACRRGDGSIDHAMRCAPGGDKGCGCFPPER